MLFRNCLDHGTKRFLAVPHPPGDRLVPTLQKKADEMKVEIETAERRQCEDVVKFVAGFLTK